MCIHSGRRMSFCPVPKRMDQIAGVRQVKVQDTEKYAAVEKKSKVCRYGVVSQVQNSRLYPRDGSDSIRPNSAKVTRAPGVSEGRFAAPQEP